MNTVYVISSNQRPYLYVGLTKNIERRFAQHQSGKERTTRAFAPFTLIQQEGFDTRIAARIREKYLKSGVGKEWLKRTYE